MGVNVVGVLEDTDVWLVLELIPRWLGATLPSLSHVVHLQIGNDSETDIWIP